MPTYISVSEDEAVQYSPNQSTYYTLHPKYDQLQVYKTAHEPTTIDPKEDIVLKSTRVHHCHTVIVKDRIYNNYFILHVSPQALRRPYDPVNKVAEKVVSSSGFGMFFMEDDAKTNLTKPAYIDLDPFYYESELIGTHPNSELEVIVVANNEYWNKEKVQERMITTLQERIPGKIIKSNVIINEALDHAYYYSVAFDPKSASLTVISNNGLYTEPYENAFDNTVHQYAHQALPAEKQTALKQHLKDLQTQSDKMFAMLFKVLSPHEGLEQIILNPPHDFIELVKTKRTEIESLINGMESIISESKNPIINLGSPALYETYKKIGLLHLCAGTYDKSEFYLSKVVDYATSMSKAEFDDDKIFFSALAGAVSERGGDLEKAYSYYKEVKETFRNYISQIDADINFARIASQIKGKEVKALMVAIKTKETLEESIRQVKKEQPPEQEKILKLINSKHTACDKLVHSLKDFLIEHRHENEVLQHEYDKLFAPSIVKL